MPVNVLQTPLMQFLQANNSNYYGKAQELRGAIAGWLNYIPATFLSYTKHTIEHSEEIISQMSKLLFEDEDPKRPVLRDLSNIEAYILIAAAYLHDAGMTVSDSEKRTILQSAEWREWIENGSGATRFRHIAEFREDKTGRIDATTRTFLADIQLRFLIAEYVRRTHHLRGGDILAMYQSEMGRFGYDDPVLIQTIASVCIAHGLQQNELNDPERFPERRDIQDEKVNVRLLAVLLRLGDLLDMSYDRACPLLLNAASPIPADSLAHWTQYQRITHKMVAHDRIELIAACENEEEHRFLHDWCAWLVAELDQARRLMVRATRHAEWEPPMASIDQATGNTITIKPAKGARYIPARWRFELDTKAVFDRLIYDALDTPWDFLRELIQNAADASRCQMFADIVDRGGEVPAYPTQVEEKIRERYPIRVTLGTTEVRNEMSGETEQRQVLTVEDEGLGMDQDVIQRYLLQVGRSYYTTRDFRDTFGFVASSRFGIGFLSVFGVSDDVTIETFKPSSATEPEPLKLRLTGPRSYLLTEKGTRRRPGTSIQVVLRDTPEPGKVAELVESWCERLEFPVIINELGVKSEINAECAEDFVTEVPSLESDNAKLIIRSFPINREGIEGNLFILAHVDEEGERWDKGVQVSNEADSHPQAVDLTVPFEAIFFHGINTAPEDEKNYGFFTRNFCSKRIDLRGERFNPTLARSNTRFNYGRNELPEIESRWDELLREHLNVIRISSFPLWAYKQKLSEYIGSTKFWMQEPELVPVVKNNNFYQTGILDIDTIDELIIAVPVYNIQISKNKNLIPEITGSVILDNWISNMKAISIDYIFAKRSLSSIEIRNDFVLCTWLYDKNAKQKEYTNTLLAEFDPEFLATPTNRISFPRSTRPIAINKSHDLGRWYSIVKDACMQNLHGLSKKQLDRLTIRIRGFVGYETFAAKKLEQFITEWNKIPNLPSSLIAPNIEVDKLKFINVEY